MSLFAFLNILLVFWLILIIFAQISKYQSNKHYLHFLKRFYWFKIDRKRDLRINIFRGNYVKCWRLYHAENCCSQALFILLLNYTAPNQRICLAKQYFHQAHWNIARPEGPPSFDGITFLLFHFDFSFAEVRRISTT